MTQLNSSNTIIPVTGSDVFRFNSINIVFGGGLLPIWEESWTYVPKILGDVKGVVSKEDKQLLKIANTWNDEQVDNAIEQYIIEYNKFISKPKFYGKESWKARGT